MHSKSVSHAKAADGLVFKQHCIVRMDITPPSTGEYYVSCATVTQRSSRPVCELGFGIGALV